MNIDIMDSDTHLDFYVDGNHAARLKVFADFKYVIEFTNGVLHELVLHGLFLATMKKRNGELKP